ncbi:hypothetical protein BACCOP_00162 [Phocaeicola coprocola DSM 17136]|uniref:Uncharacterized protein n=1 Tax=Phocaeicola coprocola DSM 17136 TaxID=470145 RepID=B3JE73_9BACT|nr:hypothetical protein BACCOP_00162 [Phocaeicola coprocola DSM 17136]
MLPLPFQLFYVQPVPLTFVPASLLVLTKNTRNYGRKRKERR